MIPIYIAKIESPDDGIYTISLVDNPAIETGFMKFKKTKQIQFSIVNSDKHIILGPVMRANFPIYRFNEEIGEYYIKYTPEVIRKMTEKLLSDNTFNNISLMHNGKLISGIKLTQLFIKDSERGLAPAGFDDIEEGSLFAEYKVEDEDLWNKIKAGEFLGFSLEGLFTIDKEENKQKYTKIYKSMMNKILKFMKSLIKLGSIETDKQTLYWLGDEDLKAGDEVFVDGEDTEPAADGEYVTLDGKTITVKDGVVESITDPEAEVDPEEGKDEKEEMEDENPEDVVEDNKEMDELKATVEEYKAKVDELTKRLEDVENRMKKIEETPAEEPLEEIFSKTKSKSGKVELIY